MGKTNLFNDGWTFTCQQLETSLDDVKNQDIQWKPIDIPHDWLIYDTNNLYKTGEGWYRKEFSVFAESANSKRYFLRFDGVYMDSTVFINGKTAFEWKYGYSAFEFEITKFLVDGVNEILVRVVYQSPNSRWYSGAGIYRNVWVKTTGQTRIVSDGVYITPVKSAETDGKWIVEVDTEIEITAEDINKTFCLRQTVIDKNKNIVSSSKSYLEIEPNIINIHKQQIEVTAPALWDITEPNLYKLKTELIECELDENIIDTEENRFGFRTLEFDTEKGFILNGKVTKLNGVCQHHDLGCLGSAVNKVALKRQINILKEMGVNAIRTSHNMPSAELMELADEMGILICSEAFDMWELSKTKYDYARFFKEWVESDVASWIRRDRNCPSVIMWSIGNEIYDTHADERGQEITKMLLELVKRHDYKNHAPVTIGSNYMAWGNAQKCADILKLAGYNYAERLYNDHHEKYPDWIIYGSETSSTVQSRGIYHFPLSQPVLADDDEQCSSLGNSTTSWGAKNTEYCIAADRDAKFSAGQFIWSGFDYIGEPTPYHTKNSYFGQIDTAGFKKDSFYIYQSAWTDYKTNPMIHIFPYWDFSPGQIIDVRVCSNAPKIELFFNEKSIGTYDIDHTNGKKLIGEWRLPYEKGILHAVAYDEKNNIIAEDIKKSFGDATEILLSPDKTEMLADGCDLIFIEISAKDKDGSLVENANNRVNISVSGEGRLVGLDNGDSTDFEQYKTTSRKLFSGKLLAVIASTHQAGEIIFKAESEGIPMQIIKFNSLPCEVPEGASRVLESISSNNKSDGSEIPIRNIELSSPMGNHLSENLRKITVKAKLHPHNATHNDLQWRVTNKAGVDSNIVDLAVNEDKHTVSLTALGDGDFYLRCMAANGSGKPRVISQLEFTITGIGDVFLDPYKFISGSLYSVSNVELGNGNERGISTEQDGESYIGFKNVNFGEFGSDEITIPIFTLSGSEFLIEFWEGMPNDPGSEYLCTVTYTKGSRWNTYLEETFKLPRRLKGLTTFCMILRQKLHIKGFTFKKIDKAYEKLNAQEYSSIYGDSFILSGKGDAIEEIGNNVSIVFDDMDFSDKGFSKIQICGRTPLEKNTIQIKFNGKENGAEFSQSIEFTKSEEYNVQEFEIKNISGKQTVTFLFLPGCQFDFKWFKFI